MASQPEFSDELIRKLTAHELDLEGMIRDLPQPKPSAISRISATSSIGRLDLLPAEPLFEVLEHLDLQCLSRISRVSLKGKGIIESFRPYRDLLAHCPQVLAALGKTQLLRFQTATRLRQVLFEENCVSCFAFGDFLFLPTCERVCFECLLQNYNLHLTSANFAKRAFAFTRNQMERIPIMRSIPGCYYVGDEVKYSRSHRLVSVKQVSQLAIHEHGSPDNVAKIMPKWGPEISFTDYWMLKQFHTEPLWPSRRGPSTVRLGGPFVSDRFPGMASIRMPSLGKSGLDYGRLCRGCHHVDYLASTGSLPYSVLREYVPPGVDPTQPLLVIVTRLWSQKGFIDHIRQCSGVRLLGN